VAVIGDSRATNYSCEPDVQAFPEVLAALVGDGIEVRNFARVALRLDRYLRDLDEVLDWGPHVVVSVFGGRESMYRMPPRLERLPCDPRMTLTDKSWRRPFLWVRLHAWRGVW